MLKSKPVSLNQWTIAGNRLDGYKVAFQEPRVALDGGREPIDPLRQGRELLRSLNQTKSKINFKQY